MNSTRNSTYSYLIIRAIIERLFCFALFFIMLPLLFFISCIIILIDGWPFLFIQKRAGFNGRRFNMIKFRTMNSSEDVQVIPWISNKNRQFTKTGTFLRKYYLDELPQLVNVCKGDMSLIGPRPEAHEIAIELESNIVGYAKKYRMNPGITGWAQVELGYTLAIEDFYKKHDLDMFYYDNIGPLIDFKIIVKTIFRLINGSGK